MILCSYSTGSRAEFSKDSLVLELGETITFAEEVVVTGLEVVDGVLCLEPDSEPVA